MFLAGKIFRHSKTPGRVFDIFKNTVHLKPDPPKRSPQNAIHFVDIKSYDIIMLYLPYREYAFPLCAKYFPLQAQPSARNTCRNACGKYPAPSARVRMQPCTAADHALRTCTHARRDT